MNRYRRLKVLGWIRKRDLARGETGEAKNAAPQWHGTPAGGACPAVHTVNRYRRLKVLGCNLCCTELARDEETGRLVILRRARKSDILACRQSAREADLLLKLNLGCNLCCTELARDEETGRLVILRRARKSDILACRQSAREADLLLKLKGRNNLCCTELARDEETGRLVILRRARKSDILACRQSAREADLLLKLKGRNAPCLYECLETETERVLVEEYIQGTPAGGLSRAQKRRVLQEAARILERIHHLGYLYLDLKEDHLFLCDDRVVLIDYDGVLEAGSRQCFFATLDSMAPELAGDCPKTTAADAWAWGMLARAPELAGDCPKTTAADAWAWGMLARRWHLYPLRRRRCLQLDPGRRRDPKPSGKIPGSVLIWMITVSVFAAGLCVPVLQLPGSQMQETDLVRQVLLDDSRPLSERLQVLQDLDEPLEAVVLEQVCRKVRTEQDALCVAAYVLRMKTEGCDMTLPAEWKDRFGSDVSQLMEWKETVND